MTEQEYAKRFGYWLKRIIIERGISQNELSRKTGISPFCLSQYIHGKRIPNSYIVMRISEELKCSYTILGCPNPIPPTDWKKAISACFQVDPSIEPLLANAANEVLKNRRG